MKRILVIGGGAAGLLAAGAAAGRGASVTLLEKNDILGKKLYLTGKGRCNLTTSSSVERIIENIPGNPYFMYSSLYKFDNQAVIRLFDSLGVKTKTERGARVFPVSNKAGDVVHALEKYARQSGAAVALGCRAKEILIEGGAVRGVETSKGRLDADAVIVATGGLSFPQTGSTGDGYRFASAAGHAVTALNPSLVPLKTEEGWVKELKGLTLKNAGILVKDGDKRIYDDFGEMLFTHYGVSGPIILSASRYLLGKYDKGCKIIIDMKPALSEKELDSRILRDFEKYINKDFKNSLDDLLPRKMIPVIIRLSGIDPDKKANAVTREERQRIIRLLKKLTVTVSGTIGYSEAVITAGGVCVDEIDPSTMESKLCGGLFFVGEVLDVDGYTGGFNLQIAFSTGYAAGVASAEQ